LKVSAKPVPSKFDSPLATFLKYSHAFAYTAEIFVNNYALNYVSYPTQVLAKSCKVVPVLVGSMLSSKAHRSTTQYMSVCMVTLGLFSFNYLDSKSTDEDTPFGLFLLAVALALDLLSSYLIVRARQEHIRGQYRPTGLQIMHYCNLYGTMLTLPYYLFVNRYEPFAAVGYLLNHSSIAVSILLFCGLR
jgi:UDP-galactose transporter B1